MRKIKASTVGLSAKLLPASILDVIDTLTSAGYEAYIVGGGVRDLILGLNPKDFDAVTNATPSQIKQVFGKRCRIIGRRFELAHVYSGRDVIEVATFRATPKRQVKNATGMILRDNHWGTIDDDFVRRDFSVNALYYQPRKGIILDFCHAIEDIKQHRLRLLGNARQRFEEDPVRMLRTIRFSAKLNFDIDQSILAVWHSDLTALLREVSPNRLYDESLKLFSSGHLTRVLPLLIHYQLWSHLLTDVPAKITPFIHQACKNTDLRLQQGKTINPAFFYAVLLWQVFQQRCQHYQQQGKHAGEARVQAGLDVLKRQAMRAIIPRFAEVFIRETWELQSRLLNPKPAQIMSILQHERFRAGFDFLSLREQAGDVDSQGMVEWWEKFQLMSNDEKQVALQQYQRQVSKKRQQQKAEKAVQMSVESVEPSLELHQEELEPLLTDARAKEFQQRQQLLHQPKREYYDDVVSEKHPMSKRKIKKRDLSQVIFGPIS